jgi:hypothetical protein
MQPISGAAAAPFGADPFWVSVAIFALAYLLIITERINRSIIALLGARSLRASIKLLRRNKSFTPSPPGALRCGLADRIAGVQHNFARDLARVGRICHGQ